MRNEPNAIQLHVRLAEIEPMIWRRMVLPLHWNLHQLHLGIQAVFNWENSHLHEFRIGPLRYGDLSGDVEPGEHDLDETDVTLAHLDTSPNSSFTYVYDFGDNWHHVIEIEDIIFLEVPPNHGFCTAGENACPPEDVGGSMGYQNFLSAMSDENHMDHASMKTWFGGEFDPAHFDLERGDKDLKNAFRANVERRQSQPISSTD